MCGHHQGKGYQVCRPSGRGDSDIRRKTGLPPASENIVHGLEQPEVMGVFNDQLFSAREGLVCNPGCKGGFQWKERITICRPF